MSFNTLSDLRKQRGNFDNLMKEVEKISNPTSNFKQGDDREWKPTVDKAGNGYAVIRFLPAPQGEDMHGLGFGITDFKVLQVNGILKTVLQRLTNQTLCQN